MNTQRHEAFLTHLFNTINDLENKTKEILEKIAINNRVIVMALNQGDIDLLMNWGCSARRYRLLPSNVIIFGGDETVVSVAKSLGFQALFHPAFGKQPLDHAEQ